LTRQLPIFAALSHAFSSVWDHRAVAFRISWAWYVILAIILAAGGQFLGGRPAGDGQTLPPDTVAIEFGMILIVLVINSSIAVNWHRFILLDEVPGHLESLRLDGRVWRYFGNTLLLVLGIGVVSVLAAFPLIFIAVAAGAMQLAPLAGLIAILAVAAFVFLRLGIKLPAIAIDGGDFRFADAWRASAGNGFQIAGLFLTAILLLLTLAFLVALVGLIDGFAAVVLGFVLQLAVNWFMTLFNISLLTSLYGFFVQGRNF
jgi:hypothetical protein